MSAREKPPPLVWRPWGGPGTREPLGEYADIGDWRITVWEVGGEIPARSRVTKMGGAYRGRVASHYSKETARASAEKRARKAAT